jgi:hypothetical protein
LPPELEERVRNLELQAGIPALSPVQQGRAAGPSTSDPAPAAILRFAAAPQLYGGPACLLSSHVVTGVELEAASRPLRGS